MKIARSTPFESPNPFLQRAAYSPTGEEIVACGGRYDQPGNALIWTLPDLQNPRVLGLSAVNPTSLALGTQTKVLAACAMSCTSVEVWDYETGRPLGQHVILPEPYQKVAAGHYMTSTQVGSMTFSPDDRQLALGCWDCSAKVIDLGTGSLTQLVPPSKHNVDLVAFDPEDPNRLVTGSIDRLFIWDLARGKVKSKLALPGDEPWKHVALEDGRILSLAHDGALRIWDRDLKGDDAFAIRYKPPATCLAYSKPHGLLAIGQRAGRIIIWDVNAKKLAGSLKVGKDDVLSIDFARVQDKLCVVTSGPQRLFEVEWTR